MNDTDLLYCFEPLTVNRWIVVIDGVPSYIVKSVELPSFKNGVTGLLKLVVYNSNIYCLEMIDAVAIKNIKIEYLSVTGEVVASNEFVKLRLCLFEKTKLDYGSDELLLTNIHFDVI